MTAEHKQKKARRRKDASVLYLGALSSPSAGAGKRRIWTSTLLFEVSYTRSQKTASTLQQEQRKMGTHKNRERTRRYSVGGGGRRLEGKRGSEGRRKRPNTAPVIYKMQKQTARLWNESYFCYRVDRRGFLSHSLGSGG